jgi:hypothetical protein
MKGAQYSQREIIFPNYYSNRPRKAWSNLVTSIDCECLACTENSSMCVIINEDCRVILSYMTIESFPSGLVEVGYIEVCASYTKRSRIVSIRRNSGI